MNCNRTVHRWDGVATRPWRTSGCTRWALSRTASASVLPCRRGSLPAGERFRTCWQPQSARTAKTGRAPRWLSPPRWVGLSDWPAGTRLIVRREPLHPGAQQALFPLGHVPLLGPLHRRRRRRRRPRRAHARAHAHIEDHIRHLRDSGGQRLPFTNFTANRAWLAVVGFADAVVRRFRKRCLAGPSPPPNPRPFHLMLWHTPARLVRRARRRVVRISTPGPPATAPRRLPALRPHQLTGSHPPTGSMSRRPRAPPYRSAPDRTPGMAAPAIHTNPKSPLNRRPRARSRLAGATGSHEPSWDPRRLHSVMRGWSGGTAKGLPRRVR